MSRVFARLLPLSSSSSRVPLARSSSSSLLLRRPLVVPSASTTLFRLQQRTLSGGTGFDKKESAEETEYFNRQERESIARLLQKMRSQSDPEGKRMSAALKTLCEKHKIKLTSQLEDDLFKWAGKAH